MPVWTWNKQLAKDSEIVIFDLDGVISDASHRQHFLKGAEKDWDGFFSACTEDPPISSGLELVNLINKLHSKNIKIILFMHSTVEPPNKSDKCLHLILSELRICDRILVHTPADLNRLKEMNLVSNVSLFPHGVLDFDRITLSFSCVSWRISLLLEGGISGRGS